MEPLTLGYKVREDLLPEHTHILDLQYFDGPLLAEFHSPSGDKFIYHWCDCDDSSNRWLVIPISQRELIQLKSLSISLKELYDIKRNSDTMVYVMDIDARFRRKQLYFYRIMDLPSSYIPHRDSFLIPALMPERQEPTFSILLGGHDWDVDALSNLLKKFPDVYALQTYYKMGAEQRFTKRPHKGGYSTRNHYGELRRFIGKEHYPTVKAMAFASPGYIEFNAAPEIGAEVSRSILKLKQYKNDLRKTFRDIEGHIRLLGVNRTVGDVQLSPQDEAYLCRQVEFLLKQVDAPPFDWLQELFSTKFEAIKAGMAHYRRLKDLEDLLESGRISFAMQP